MPGTACAARNSEPLQDGETVRLGEYDILVQLGHDIALPGSGNRRPIRSPASTP